MKDNSSSVAFLLSSSPFSVPPATRENKIAPSYFHLKNEKEKNAISFIQDKGRV